MTGAGGFVQSIINGYGGVRVRQNNNNNNNNNNRVSNASSSVLSFNMSVPPGASALKLRSVSFHGARLSAQIATRTGNTTICLLEEPPPPTTLLVDGTNTAAAAAAAAAADTATMPPKLRVTWPSGAASPTVLRAVGDCAVGRDLATVELVAG